MAIQTPSDFTLVTEAIPEVFNDELNMDEMSSANVVVITGSGQVTLARMYDTGELWLDLMTQCEMDDPVIAWSHVDKRQNSLSIKFTILSQNYQFAVKSKDERRIDSTVSSASEEIGMTGFHGSFNELVTIGFAKHELAQFSH